MLNRSNVESLDVALRDLMFNVHPALERVPFGGKVVVCTGDYRQILPVVKNENRCCACFPLLQLPLATCPRP